MLLTMEALNEAQREADEATARAELRELAAFTTNFSDLFDNGRVSSCVWVSGWAEDDVTMVVEFRPVQGMTPDVLVPYLSMMQVTCDDVLLAWVLLPLAPGLQEVRDYVRERMPIVRFRVAMPHITMERAVLVTSSLFERAALLMHFNPMPPPSVLGAPPYGLFGSLATEGGPFSAA